jgi:hypothetical protein
MKNRVLFLIIFCLALIACNLPSSLQGGPTPTGSSAGGTPLATPTLGSPLDTPVPSDTPVPAAGWIEGGIYGYPYGSTPGLVFVAFNQENSFYWYWIIPSGQSYYTTDAFIPPGKYLVVAYDSSGHKGGCTTIAMVLTAASTHCDITDWAGSYPSKPSSVPAP